MTKGFRRLIATFHETVFSVETHMLDATTAFDSVDGQCFVDAVHLSQFGN